jgi:hypothetical protein
VGSNIYLLLQTDSIFADYENYANKTGRRKSNKLEKINATLPKKDLQMHYQKAKQKQYFILTGLTKWLV